MRRSPGMKIIEFTFAIALWLVSMPVAAQVTPADNGPFPPNEPSQWVCPGTNNISMEDFCSSLNGVEPLPEELQNPPPLADLDAKNAFDLAFEAFLRERAYAQEPHNWVSDHNWRLTGPYVGMIGSGSSYGTHPAVKIYYSPEVVEWLCGGRTGDIPDGAAIIKEMHPIDEALDITLNDQGCMVIQADVPPASWTTFIKSSENSFDGWYYGSYSAAVDDPTPAEVGNPPILDRSAITSLEFFNGTIPPLAPNPNWYPTGYVYDDVKFPDTVYPYSIYGHLCINCHASAEKETIFSSLDNILGTGLGYKQYESDDAAFEEPLPSRQVHNPPLAGLESGNPLVESDTEFVNPFTSPLIAPMPEFLAFYDQLGAVNFTQAWELRLPAQTYDHIVSGPDGPEEFITSDQCAGCHDATFLNASTPNMLFEVEKNGSKQLVNLSPRGEFLASPMGLAGRDPIFFSQLQSETNNLPELTTCIENTCLHCHGVMGQRQLAIDTPGQDEGCKSLFTIPPPPEVPFGKPFALEMVTQWPKSPDNSSQKYGALARDGISCAVCHHIIDTALGTESSYTGNFVTGPANELYGPFQTDTIIPKPMQNALGITPLFGNQITDSNMCSSCHNILLPVFDNDGTQVGSSYEQTTGLEWRNSEFAAFGSTRKTCQDCHMPRQFKGTDLTFEIANIESSAFAPTTNRLPLNEIQLTPRDNYSRHSLHGLNIFINQMFQQFPLILGARQIDYMTGTSAVPPLITGARSMINMAQNETAEVSVESLELVEAGVLEAVVKVTNKVGHYFPSGVGFRRAFLEFLVRDANGEILWASGRTNKLGAIVRGNTDEVLPSEQPVKFPDAPFQPHYQLVDQEDQVQIYQELIKDSSGALTTSFLRRVTPVKGNRLRPKGFDPEFFAKDPSPFIQELAVIHGAAASDPYYTDPTLTGADLITYRATLDPEKFARIHDVKVTLYSQSIPPFYLQQRFRDANRGPQKKNEIERLYYLTSHLNVDDTTDKEGRSILESWKFFVAGQTRELQPNLPDTSILATNGIKLGKGSEVASGNVIDNAGNGTIKVGKDANTAADFELIANKVVVKKNALVESDVASNRLKNKGTITGEQTTGVELPVFPGLPPFPGFSAGRDKVVVKKNEALTLPAGNYGRIVVRRGGRLTFSGGIYNVRSIDAKKGSSLLFGAASEVRIAKKLITSKDTFIGPDNGSGISAADIVFYVAGRKAALGKDSRVQANFYAPDGKILFRGNEATGSFIGKQLKTGKGSTVHLDSFLAVPLEDEQ